MLQFIAVGKACIEILPLISIHLMLQFILRGNRAPMSHDMISIHLMLQFINKGDANLNFSATFQYISCCSLSMLLPSCLHLFFSFQYISCCSLSVAPAPQAQSFNDFNTSHVVVYPISTPNESDNSPHFNTSHVVVYLIHSRHKNFYFFISIHLMLQFICCNTSYSSLIQHFNTSHVVVYHVYASSIACLLLFQYISCCSLSQSAKRNFRTGKISIHLMLQFIRGNRAPMSHDT